MKRIQVLLSVVALLVMMAVTAAPAFAAGFAKEDNRGTHGAYDHGWHGEGDWGVGNGGFAPYP
jgi:hypothetical protein